MDCFESLDVWRKSADLAVAILEEFKVSRDYAYKDQITRAGLSISSNIAEGFERSNYKQFGYFLKIAKGSAGELRSQIYVGMKVGYIDQEIGEEWLKQAREIARMLHSLIESTNRNAAGKTET